VKRIYTRGSGAGGQNRNRRETVVELTHLPTNIKVHSESQRTQEQNEKIAWEELTKRVSEHYRNLSDKKVSNNRRAQIGSGHRGDKIRTYNFKSGMVKDHRNNKKCNLNIFLRGNIDLLS